MHGVRRDNQILIDTDQILAPIPIRRDGCSAILDVSA